MRDPVTSTSALVAAVADGETIDWGRARERVTEVASPLLANLQVIDQIAKASIASRDMPPTAVGSRRWTAFLLVALLPTLAAGQVIGAVAGYVAGVSGPGPTAAPVAIATVLVFAAASSWLGLGGRADPRAQSLAIFYLLIAAAFARRFLPVPEAGVLAAAARNASPDAFLSFFLWRFVGQFPRTVRFGPADRLCSLAEHATLTAGLFLFTTTVLLGAHLTPWLQVAGRSHPSGLYWGILLGLALPALPVAWWRSRSAPPEEGRRLAVFTTGLLVGTAPMVVDVVLEVMFPRFSEMMAGNRRYQALAFQVFLLSTPLVTAYSVVVDRVLDVHLAVGRALQAVFARATLALIAGLPFVALGVLAYSRRDLSLARLLSSGTGVGMVLLAGTGLIMWAGRVRVLRTLDRRFFRPGADIARDLPQLAATMRNAASRTDLATLLETRLATVLHATPVAMLMSGPSGESFIPVRSDVPPLPVRSALSAIMAAHAHPLPVGPCELRSCYRFLPPCEQDWIRASNAAVLLPLVGSHDARVGLIAAGPKQSGLPYAREDLSFLTTIAPATALALEVRGVLERDEVEPAAECPRCGRVGMTLAEICDCGSSRQAATVPPVVAGKFRVESRIGSGGMGVVYRARDVGLDRVVALKTLPRLSARAGDRLRHEAQMMASVVHPNLATIYGLERWRNTPILVVEFLDGGNLFTRLRAGPQPIDDVLQLGSALASALQHLHERRILHGDVKPSNIAFSGDSVPKLLDFGVARFLSAFEDHAAGSEPPPELGPLATQSFALGGCIVAGTPLYLSPEAARGSDAHDDFDLWALAIVLYEAIAGTHPFAAPTILDVLDRVRVARVPDLRQFRPDCPAAVASALTAMLSRRRAERPRTADAFLGMLERCAQGQSGWSIDVGSKRR